MDFKKVFASRGNSLTGSQAGQIKNCVVQPDRPGAGSPDNLRPGPGSAATGKGRALRVGHIQPASAWARTLF